MNRIAALGLLVFLAGCDSQIFVPCLDHNELGVIESKYTVMRPHKNSNGHTYEDSKVVYFNVVIVRANETKCIAQVTPDGYAGYNPGDKIYGYIRQSPYPNQ